MGKRIIIYTDASYDKELKVAACGYVILINQKMVSHNVYMVSEIQTSLDAEKYAIMLAIKDLPDMQMFDIVFINTDCLICTTLSVKKGTVINTQYKKAINKIASFGVKITMRHVKGHGNNKFNLMVDRSCLTQLRSHRENIKEILKKSDLKPLSHKRQ